MAEDFKILSTSKMRPDVLNRMQKYLGPDWHLRNILSGKAPAALEPTFKVVWERQ